jgi:hypothetical protein
LNPRTDLPELSISLSWQGSFAVRDGKQAASTKHEARQIRDFRFASINGHRETSLAACYGESIIRDASIE